MWTLTVDTDTLYVNSTNNRVGIGTSSPTEKLHIAATVPTIRLEDTDDGYSSKILQSGDSLFLDADHNNVGSSAIVFRVGGSDQKMRIDSDGNVGIGTTTATARLSVNQNTATGNVNLADFHAPAASANALVRIITRDAADTGTTSVDFYKQYQSGFGIHNNDTDASNFTRFIVGASERMRITSSGNVGIGTTEPNGRLTIAGNTDIIGGGSLYMQNASRVQFGGSDAASIIGQDGSGGYLSFAVNNEAMRILSSGNVGIGTSNPSQLLHVSGTGSGARFERTDAPASIETHFGGGNAAFKYSVNGASSYTVGIDDADSDKFKVSFRADDAATFGNDLIVINNNGNVGIGTSSPQRPQRN